MDLLFTAPVCEPLARLTRWLSSTRWYRAAAGLGLSGYSIEQVLASGRAGSAIGASTQPVALFTRMLQHWIDAWPTAWSWAVAALLALCIAAGARSRLLPTLLLVPITLAQRTDPTFSSAVAGLTTAWLVLLPNDREPSGDLTIRLYLAAIAGIYLNIGAWSGLWPAFEASTPLRLTAALVPASWCFPLRSAQRWVGASAQLVFHACLASEVGLSAAHWLLATTCVLALRPPRAASEVPGSAGLIDARAALAAVLVATYALFSAAQAIGAHSAAAATATVLRDVGQTPELFAFRPQEAPTRRALAAREEH